MADQISATDHKDSIFIIGGNHASRSRLINDAIGREVAFVELFVPSIRSSKFTISTKYYDAAVNFLSLHETHDGSIYSRDLDNVYRSHVESLSSRVDALVVLHGEEISKEECQTRLREFLEHVTEVWAPNVLLYVVEDEDALPSDVSDWCLDNGFEVVSLKSSDKAEIDPEERFVEKTGLARIVEALESNMWSNMVYKTDLRPQDKRPIAKMDEESEEEEDLADIPPEVMSTFGDIMKYMKSDGSLGTMPASAQTVDELDTDFEASGFGGVLAAMGPIGKLREQLSSLPDEQRRKMAAKIALSLMGMMGDDDDEDLF